MHSVRAVATWAALSIGLSFAPLSTLRPSTGLWLNRVLFESHECCTVNGSLRAAIPPSDHRAKHVREVLRLEHGDGIRLGVLGVGATDRGTYLCEEDGLAHFCLGPADLLHPTEPPRVDLILAVPRPLRLERLLPVVAALGVRTLALVGADKVEKDYFGSHLFRRPERLQACLVEGLAQAGVDCVLPSVIVRKNLLKFMHADLDALFDSDCMRVIFHPIKADAVGSGSRRLSALSNAGGARRVVVAIGPEGGWTDAELALFLESGFVQTDLGDRVLRTDTAVVAALALAHEWIGLHAHAS